MRGFFPARTFYVDATGGNDSNTGLSSDAAWQTIGKVNGGQFFAGDTILFKRGETWTGTKLTPVWSGSSGNPITFDAYGSGSLPIIDGDASVHCVQINGNHHHIDFKNLDLYNGIGAGAYVDGVHDIRFYDVDCHFSGNDGITFINSAYDCLVSGGNFYDNVNDGSVRSCGIEVADGCHDITISNTACYNNDHNGIAVISHAGETMPYAITISNNTTHDNDQSGFFIGKTDAGDEVVCNATLSGNDFQDGQTIADTKVMVC